MATVPPPPPPPGATGAKADPFDDRDLYYIPATGTIALSHVDLREKTQLTIYNQGKTNSCTANAAAAAFWYEEKVRGDPTWGTDGPSRAFIYWLARGGWEQSKDYAIANVTDDGSWLRMAMYGIAKCGACPEINYKFPNVEASKSEQKEIINTKPLGSVFEKAKGHTINSYYRLDADRPYKEDLTLSTADKDKLGNDLLNKLKLCLSEGFPVCFTLWFFTEPSESWIYTSTPYLLIDPWKSLNISRHTYGHKNGGHSVIAIGLDDSKQQVLVQNSWGTQDTDEKAWGNGLFWMPYSWVTDFCATVDFWTIRLNQSVIPNAPSVQWEQINQEILGRA